MNKKFENAFKNWPIKKKLLVSHGSIIVLTFILIVALLAGMKTIEGKIVKLYEGPTTNTFYIGDFRYALAGNQRAINRVIAVGSSVVAEEEAALQSNYDLMANAHDILAKNLITAEDRARLDNIWTALEEEKTHRAELIKLMEAGDFAAVNEYDEAYYTPLVTEIRSLVEELDQSIYATAGDFCDESALLAIILIIVGVIMLILVTALAVYMAATATKNITEPVQQLEEAAHRLYAGDMKASKDLTYRSDDELGSLAEALRGSMDTLSAWVDEIAATLSEIAHGNLTKPFDEITDFRGDFHTLKDSFTLILKSFNETLSQISESAHQVDIGSDEIAKSAGDLAEGTTEQASAVQELTATITTVAAAASDSADQTDKAYITISQSVKNAEKDREQVQLLQDEMQRIKEISSEVQNIIGTIEDIASQTSLLALNASIEAARAGDAGRGFAVVADQIGKLAQDSAQAAVSTKALIETTVEEIDKGNSITDTTVSSFGRIIQDMEEFAVIAKDVSESSRGAANVMLEIEKGIDQISGVTQQNAAASEESSAVSEQLAAKAAELNSLVTRFKLYQNS